MEVPESATEPDQDELAEQDAEQAGEQARWMEVESRLAAAERHGGNGRERLNLALRFYLKEMIDELSCCVVLTEENALLPEDYATLLQERDRFEHALRELVRAGIADGSIVPCDPKLAVFTILGAIHWVSKWFNQSGAWSADAVSQSLTDLLDRMVSATPVLALPTDIGKTGANKRKSKRT